MLPATHAPEANSSGSKSTKISLALETLAILIVGVSLLAMIFALSTVLQNGFQ